MSSKSSIEWTDATWTPIRARVKEDAAKIAKAKGYTSLIQIAKDMAGHVGPHCEHVSPGCEHCYSETNNGRCLTNNGTGLPFDRRARDLVDIFIDEKILQQPLHWKKPRNVFVCSQTDLFAEFVPDEFIDRVFAVMALCAQHTFQVLTKRAERMCKYLSQTQGRRVVINQAGPRSTGGAIWTHSASWPLPNVWLGVSAENQQYSDERIPWLLKTPAAVRFVSYEPALGPVNFHRIADCRGFHFDALSRKGGIAFRDGIGLDWGIIGGESGPGARPSNVQNVRNTIAQFRAACVPLFVKQLGARVVSEDSSWGHEGRYWTEDGDVMGPVLRNRKGGKMDEWPEDLRVREYPA